MLNRQAEKHYGSINVVCKEMQRIILIARKTNEAVFKNPDENRRLISKIFN